MRASDDLLLIDNFKEQWRFLRARETRNFEGNRPKDGEISDFAVIFFIVTMVDIFKITAHICSGYKHE